MITSNAQFDSQKNLISQRPIIFINIPGIDIYLASRYLNIGNGGYPANDNADSQANWSDGAGADYEDLEKSLGAINIKVDRLGGFATIANTNIDIVDLENFSDLLLLEPIIENLPVDIYLVFDDQTGLQFNEAIKFFSGIIDDKGWDYDKFNISVSNSFIEQINKVFLIDQEQIQSGVAKKDFVFYNIIYGNHEFLINSNTPSTAVLPNAKNNLIPYDNNYLQVIYEPDELDRRIWFPVSRHALESLPNSTFDDCQIWLYDSESERRLLIDPDYVEVSDLFSDGNTWVAIEPDSNDEMLFQDHIFPVERISGPPWGIVTDHDDNKVIDDNVSSYTSGTFISIGGPVFDQSLTVVIRAKTPDDYDYFESDMYVRFRSEYNNLTGDDTGVTYDLTVTNAAPPQDIKSITSATINTFTYGNLLPDLQDGTISEIEIAFDPGWTALDIFTSEAEAYFAYIRVDVKIADITDKIINSDRFSVVIGPKGQEYTSDWSGRGPSVGSLMENPQDIAEHIFREYLGLADVNTTVFDGQRANRAAWPNSFAITEELNIVGLMRELSQANMFMLFMDNNNDLTVNSILVKASEKFAVSEKDEPAHTDIFSDSPMKSFTIKTGINDKLDFNVPPGGAFVATLPQKSDANGYPVPYTSTQMLSVIKAAMEAAAAITVTVTYVSSIFTISTSPNSILKPNTGPNKATSAYSLLGYDTSVDTASAASHPADFTTYDNAYSENVIVENSLSFRNTDSSEQANQINFKYGFSEFTGGLVKESSDSDATSITNYGTLEKSIENKFIFDDTAHGNFQALYLNEVKNRPLEVGFTSNLDAIVFQPGDIINIRSEIINGKFSDYQTKKWQITTVTQDTINDGQEVKITAVEKT